MQPPDAKEITQLLVNWGNGDQAALSQLMPVVYQELRKIANSYLRDERSSHTLQPIELRYFGGLSMEELELMRRASAPTLRDLRAAAKESLPSETSDDVATSRQAETASLAAK